MIRVPGASSVLVVAEAGVQCIDASTAKGRRTRSLSAISHIGAVPTTDQASRSSHSDDMPKAACVARRGRASREKIQYFDHERIPSA